MNRPPISIVILTFAGVLLGALMIAEGLYARLFRVFLSGAGALSLWLVLPRALASDPSEWALPMVIVGTIWMGGLAALWLGWPSGRRLVAVLALFSLVFLGPGTLLGLTVLLCLLTPSARRWSQAVPVQHG